MINWLLLLIFEITIINVGKGKMQLVSFCSEIFTDFFYNI